MFSDSNFKSVFVRVTPIKWRFLVLSLVLSVGHAGQVQQVVIITNVDDCANAHTVFYRNQQGLIGVASEVPTTDWPMPEKGDRLEGDFSSLGNVLVDYLNKTGQVLLNIEQREAPKGALQDLMKRFCTGGAP